MVNQQLFNTKMRNVKETDTTNKAGGVAYSFEDKHAITQLVCTGMLNGTYYATAQEELSTMLQYASGIDSEYLRKLACYGRHKGYMKDTPALLCAILHARKDLDKNTFNTVIDNGRMLRTFVQIVRSGVTGRCSFGTRTKRFISDWINNRDERRLLNESVGNNPSIADIIKMVRVRPENKSRDEFYAYLIGKEYNFELLPDIVKEYINFRKASPENREIPRVEFRLLDNLGLTKEEWASFVDSGGWHMVRMNLNTFARHGVFDIVGMDEKVANRLADANAISRNKVFPYQLFMAYQNSTGIPIRVKNALHDAMEMSVGNIQSYESLGYKNIYVCCDVSASMGGTYGSQRSNMRPIDIAALFSTAIARKNQNTTILPFNTEVLSHDLDNRDTILTNTKKLTRLLNGGTNCSSPLRHIVKADLIVLVSDNESWADRGYYKGTGVMNEFDRIVKNNPNAKLVCIDTEANVDSQAREGANVLNVGGFSDNVFEVIGNFLKNGRNAEKWVEVIENFEFSQVS